MLLIAEMVGRLKRDPRLTSRLADGVKGIHHQASPHGCRHPHIVYSIISDVPVLFGDDVELHSRLTVRLHIVTKDGAYDMIYCDVQRIMQNLGFMRVQTTEFYEDSLKILVIDYRIGVDAYGST